MVRGGTRTAGREGRLRGDHEPKEGHLLRLPGPADYYRLKTPFTIIETVEIPMAKSREDNRFRAYEWDLGKHITGPGAYRVMLHCNSWFHDVEVRNLVITADGKPLLTLPEARFRVKHEKYDFEVKEPDPAAKFLLRAGVRKAGKDKRCTFEVCIRKEAP